MRKLKASRTYFTGALLLGFFALLLMDPESVLAAGKKAVNLCLETVIPSLLPFFVISRLILKTGAIHGISRLFKPVIKPLFNLPGHAAFPILAGSLSGYPAGAKYTTDLYRNGLLTKKEAQRLLAFCNNSGPLFIVGAVATGYFNNPGLGMILWVCHLLASITVGIASGLISRVRGIRGEETKSSPENRNTEFSGAMLTDAILDSVMVLLRISGTIIVFAVLVQTLETAGLFTYAGRLLAPAFSGNNVYSEVLKVVVSGGLEITYGLYLLSITAGISDYGKILLAAFLCGFGGLSVHTQVAGLCPEEFKLKEYFTGKLAQGIIATVYTGLFLARRTLPAMVNTAVRFETEILRVLSMIYILLLAAGIFYLFCYGLSHGKKSNHRCRGSFRE